MDVDAIINQLHELEVHGKVERRGPGRPRSIPPWAFETILTLYRGGQGYRSIANHLRTLGVNTTYSAVRRVIKGQGAYARPSD